MTSKKFFAELIGTFALVFFGCGVAIATGCSNMGDSAYAMTALAFGLVIVGMAYSIGRVSGCHVNPAVSLGVFCAGRMSFSEFIGYICAQVVGAILGAFVLFAIAGVGGTNAPADGVSVVSALALECILTFFFVLVILFVTNIAQYAINGYEVEAVDYVIKPIGYYDFSMKLRRAIKRARQNRPMVLVVEVSVATMRAMPKSPR